MLFFRALISPSSTLHEHSIEIFSSRAFSIDHPNIPYHVQASFDICWHKLRLDQTLPPFVISEKRNCNLVQPISLSQRICEVRLTFFIGGTPRLFGEPAFNKVRLDKTIHSFHPHFIDQLAEHEQTALFDNIS
jgi:hypothetical protein